MSRISIWLMARLRGRKELSRARKPPGSLDRHVGREARVDDPVTRPSLDVHPAHHALAAHPGPGGHPLAQLVVGIDEGLHPAVLADNGGHLAAYVGDRVLAAPAIRAMPSATVVTSIGSLTRPP